MPRILQIPRGSRMYGEGVTCWLSLRGGGCLGTSIMCWLHGLETSNCSYMPRKEGDIFLFLLCLPHPRDLCKLSPPWALSMLELSLSFHSAQPHGPLSSLSSCTVGDRVAIHSKPDSEVSKPLLSPQVLGFPTTHSPERRWKVAEERMVGVCRRKRVEQNTTYF